MLTTICVIVISIFAAQSPSKPSPGDVYRMASPSVVLIETYGEDGKAVAAGTGFLVSADGAILTNYHVISRLGLPHGQVIENLRSRVGLVLHQAVHQQGIADASLAFRRLVRRSVSPHLLNESLFLRGQLVRLLKKS